ncbi:hypothetical protein GINT2_000891 [Glugoides intestinalis]
MLHEPMLSTNAVENSAKIREFTTSMLRKIKKIEYKNVHYIPGYEKTEVEYVAMKNSLNNANAMIKNLMSYEHGNRFLKIIKNSIQSFSEKTSLNIYKNKDVFEEMSAVARRMSMMNLDTGCKKTAQRFSDAYKKLSDSKKTLNTRLESIRLQLKEKRNYCIEIDHDRKKLKNMRYSLEVLLQDGGYNGEIRDAEKKIFTEFSSKVLKKMLQFGEDASIGGILKSISREYAVHLKETADVLKCTE